MICTERDQLDHISDSPETHSFPAGNDLGGEGLYYFNARWYDPQLGRFITEDPVKDGLNWYAYVSNNPLRYVDPTGLTEEEANLLTLAQDTYSWGGGAGVVPPVSTDDWDAAGYEFVEPPEDIAAMFSSESGFKANLYKNKETGEHVLAFAGTDLFSGKDWKENISQGRGNPSEQYNKASKLAIKMKQEYGDSLSFTGHSLGGGLASYAASETGLKATTFNAAGLHKDNRNESYKSNINAIVLSGDILNVSQDIGFILPEAFGIRKPIGNPFANVVTATGGVGYGAIRHGAFDKMRELLRNE